MASVIARPRRRPESWLIPLLIALATFLAFSPSLKNGFVDWDDDVNFLNNPFYRGLGAEQLRWMFTAFHSGHYLPLTWLTLSVDYVVWGMNPTGYHLTSLLLHVGSAIVVYFIAMRLLAVAVPPHGNEIAGIRLGGAFAALLFAIHPLRVESVAWVTERRDVLSALFYLLTIFAYLRYQDAGRRRWYLTALGFFAAALLSKSMAVTLPVVLLVIDACPLKRRAWADKLPFFLLSLAASVVAFVAVRVTEALSSTALGPLERTAISVYALAFYLWKMALPVNLSPLYELPEQIDVAAWPFLLSAAMVLAITGALLAFRHRTRAWLAVWTAYIVILLPVVGIIHNGPQIAADRYTYLASVGWAILGGAGLRLGWRAWRDRALAWPAALLIAGLAGAIITGLGVLTSRQAGVWHDSVKLWTHALSVRPSSFGHSNLGAELLTQGKLDEAIEHHRKAVQIRPSLPTAHYNLGVALDRQGTFAEAVEEYREALRLSLSEPEAAHYNLARSLARLGRLDDAVNEYRNALRLKPSDAETHFNLALALARQGHLPEAVQQYREALRLNPRHAEAHHYVGVALARLGKTSEAIEHYREALRLKPAYGEAHSNLGVALAAGGDLGEAAEQFRQALRLNPDSAETHNNLGVALAQQGRTSEAIEHFREATRIKPDFLQARNNLDEVLATARQRTR